MSTPFGKGKCRSPLDVDVNSKISKKEDTIQVPECVDDEINDSTSAVDNAKCSIVKATDDVILLTADIDS